MSSFETQCSTEAKQLAGRSQGGARAVDLPVPAARSFDLARPGVAQPLISLAVTGTHCYVAYHVRI